MKAQLLDTKTRVPRLPREWTPRPRVAAKLREALGHKLVLLLAPAGYGKTTLVVDGLRDVTYPVGWVSLDAKDNFPELFLIGVITSLQGILPVVCRPLLEAFESPEPPSVNWVLTALGNAIARYQGDFALVLDDYQEINRPAVHEAIEYLVGRLPANAHIIITAHNDPPLPLARWRTAGDMMELHKEDLAFTAEEAAAYLQHAIGSGLTAEEITTLESRSEGWIAGLKMAALSLRDNWDVAGFINDIDDGHYRTLDYLAEEVLQRQPSEVREFLLESALLERMSGPLCDSVTGRGGSSQTMLEQLDAANMFIAALDDERRWYRYHPLFRTFLNKRLILTEPANVGILYERASKWYELAGLWEEAIDYALMADDVERASDLLVTLAQKLVRQGRAIRLLDYYPRIPQAQIVACPWLCVAFAWAALLSGQWDLLKTLLNWAEAATLETPKARPSIENFDMYNIEGHILTMRGYIARAENNIEQSIELAGAADRILSSDDLRARNVNSINLGVNHLIVGDVPQAIHYLEEAKTTARRSGNRSVELSSQAYLAEAELLHSRLNRTVALCEDCIEKGVMWGAGGPLPSTALAYVILGEAWYERNDLASAAKLLAEGAHLAEENANWTVVLKGYVAMARVAQAQGDFDSAKNYLRYAKEFALRAPHAREASSLTTWEALMTLRQGDVEVASQWASQLGSRLPLDKLPAYSQEFAYLTLCRLKLVMGDCRGLPEHLDDVIRRAKAQERGATVIETLVLKARALDCLGDFRTAQATFDQALSLAEPGGFVRVFVDEGVPIAMFLRQAMLAGLHEDYAAKLLSHITT